LFYTEKVICWAISAAGIVADNHVVSGTVNWKPNLSTTWCLTTYPQNKCQGGNPGILYQDISENGIATNNCVDYSWCSENEACNGKATGHFQNQNVNLSDLIPTTKRACYDSRSPHYLYFIDTPISISIGTDGLIGEDFTNTVKKHIYYNGPVQGGFLVYKNFMSGAFTKVNGGVYLEQGDYTGGQINFDEEQLDDTNYMGSHAIAIIGWGIEKNVVVDNEGSKKDIPYWYCRNSWTEKWGDGGYFKMAMYPYNEVVQFDKTIFINNMIGGGMVMIKASKPPQSLTFQQIEDKFIKLSKPSSYYSTETKDYGKDQPTPPIPTPPIPTPTPPIPTPTPPIPIPTPTPPIPTPTPPIPIPTPTPIPIPTHKPLTHKPPTVGKNKATGSKKKLYIILVCILLIAVIAGLVGIFLYHIKRNTTNYNMLSPISSSYTPSTPNSYHPSTPN